MKTETTLLLLLALLPWGLCGQETPGEELPVREHTLENGLRLLVLPREGAPTVSFVVQYPIGGVNEVPGVTGISHLLEHLLFKGTSSIGTRDYEAELPLFAEMDLIHDSILAERQGPSPDRDRIHALREKIRALEVEASEFVVSNEFDAILSENGARGLNATTTSESTTYFVELPSNRTELWFILEADRMRNPVFREFYTERDVVAEERRLRLEDNPPGVLYEIHLAEAFLEHPYGAPVVGTMEDINGLTRSGVQEYFRRFYGPNNAVVVVVGDLDPDEVLEWSESYLGPIPPGVSPLPVQVQEPKQEAERRVDLHLDAEPGLRIGWKVPSVVHEDAPALSMLASILTGGRSSRLYRRLVLEDRIATAVTSGTVPGSLYPGLFSVESVPRSPHTTEEVETAIYEEIQRLKDEGPEEMELQRVRNQLEASGIRRLSSNLGLALQMAQSETLLGDWRETFAATRAMEEVTPEDIREVVRRYFRDDQRTVATLRRSSPPQGGSP